ncbi:3-(3-hydroxyphenyl)propionate hydroxylase [Mycobacterium basiliense]|uniref:3-(3-hydroxyphenyl)propionate hydroxylase n=1 Tax=Mycobacterium basiliense TaxID=2094119 RepID=A0A3S4FS31_9MYCO|nr:3-(3-hydroxyphenyl)propionate hydroxylase [Mycobacterium basiliense]
MVDETADVVISGAGPNGLMLACELALAEIRPLVLDKLPGPSGEPKANGLVGQVVRMLHMRGLYLKFSGCNGPPEPSPGWMFAAMPLDFVGMVDNPMYTMRMPQPRLVRLLAKRARDLRVDLRWGHELTGLHARADSVAIAVSSPKRDYRIMTSFLVGADGGRSLVRKSVGIDFPAPRRPPWAGSPMCTSPTRSVVPKEGSISQDSAGFRLAIAASIEAESFSPSSNPADRCSEPSNSPPQSPTNR